MSKLLFQPWIGKEYGKSSYGKLLIVGESHYFYHQESDYGNFTKKIISGLGTEKDNKFYIQVGNLFNPTNYLDIWQKVAFANAIQFPFKESRQAKTKEQILTIAPAIQEYLNITQPKKMLVVSSLVWNQGLPDNIPWGQYIESIHDDDNLKKASIWEFNYTKGKCLGMGIPHCSSLNPYFRVEEWRPIVNKFLQV